MVSEGHVTNETGIPDASQTPRLVFLVPIMGVSCTVNSLLLFALFHNWQVYHALERITIVNIAAVCLGDSLLNMSLVMGSLASGSHWTFNEALCKWHTFVMNLLLVESVLLLTVLTCDRFLVIRFSHKYDSLVSPVRLAFVIVITWAQSIAFSIPFFFDSVQLTFRPELHTCSASDISLVFICTALLFCFFVPAVTMCIMLILIYHANHKRQHKVKTIMSKNHSNQLVEASLVWQGILTEKYVGVLCLLCFILVVPYVITTIVQQYKFHGQLHVIGDYPWVVIVVCMWMKFTFSAAFPCVTFVCKKDLWHSCKQLIVCHRNNSVVDMQVKVNPTRKTASVNKDLNAKVTSTSKEREQQQPRSPNLLSFNVPVLFATSEGIHIETHTSHNALPDLEGFNLNSRDNSLNTSQLDIGDYSKDNSPVHGDISWYDSNAEAFPSAACPLSDKHIRSTLGSSWPDVHTEGQTERVIATTICVLDGSRGIDSGLELSGTMSFNGEKEDINLLNRNANEHDHVTVTLFGHEHKTVTNIEDNTPVIPDRKLL